MPILLQHHVGRLLESRFVTPIDRGDLDTFDRDRGTLRLLFADERVVVMDFRRATILPPELADTLVDLLQSPSQGLLRNGVLVPTASPTVAMQLARIVREGNSDLRRVFRSTRDLAAWLGEVLVGAERKRLHLFLAEDSPFASIPAEPLKNSDRPPS
jgi:hypothetical protein